MTSLLSAGPCAAAPSLTLDLEPGETRLFDHDAEACEPWDIPDTPTRAYRDAGGDIHVFQTHFRNRTLIGRDFVSLAHGCAIAFEGRDTRDAASPSHRGWIASTHTADGVTVHAIVHDEYHGERFGDPGCSTDDPQACWYNRLTAAVSRDGGATFKPAEPRLVAALPFRADATRGDHAGYFEPTNILEVDGAFYMMANVVSPPPQTNGNCLLRTDDPSDPGKWRGWRDGGFTTAFADPYAGTPNVEAQLCDPIDPAALPWPVTSLTRHLGTGLFLATMSGRAKDAGGTERTGVYYSTSPDLHKWSGPALLLEAPPFGACAPARPIAYPALIDPDSPDRNFCIVGDRPALTFVQGAPDGCELGPDRDVILRRVKIAPTR